ncbi:MAG: MazG-like family protein [Pelotomaculum sp. PtaU1.Bin035]|nr:MAG: MazG-like family protein [Pelotomaculum sp. PtaU1.Bin035]
MITGGQEGGIAKNIKVIEWLKADLITTISALFKSMLRGSEELILDALASLVITCYILGRRLGINFSRLDLKVEVKLRQSIDEGHEVERWYGDISTLLNYLVDKKR